jgi:hypothetical protein
MTKLELFVLTVKDRKTGVRVGIMHVDDNEEHAKHVAKGLENQYVYVEINRVTYQMVKSEEVK